MTAPGADNRFTVMLEMAPSIGVMDESNVAIWDSTLGDEGIIVVEGILNPSYEQFTRQSSFAPV